MLKITVCPSCGSKDVREVTRNLSGTVRRRRYVVRDLRFLECASCGERVYDPAAMRRIEAVSPAFGHGRRRKKSA